MKNLIVSLLFVVGIVVSASACGPTDPENEGSNHSCDYICWTYCSDSCQGDRGCLENCKRDCDCN